MPSSKNYKRNYKVTFSRTTEGQYKRISGRWDKYFNRLIRAKPERRETLTPQDLIDILIHQDYRCALTGVELTCQLENGVVSQTNASIDRLEAGGPYTKDNIQLVCRAVNSFRRNVTIDEFKWWCKKVTEYAEQ